MSLIIIFKKRINLFWCKLAQVVRDARTSWDDQLWRSGGQRSRSHKTEDWFGCLAETSFSTLATCTRGRETTTKNKKKDADTLHHVAVRPDQPRSRVETKFDVRGDTLDVVPVLGFWQRRLRDFGTPKRHNSTSSLYMANGYNSSLLWHRNRDITTILSLTLIFLLKAPRPSHLFILVANKICMDECNYLAVLCDRQHVAFGCCATFSL